MNQVLPTLAKRLLAFTLALVLLLALVPALPLTADAAVETDGWEYNTSYSRYYKTAEFVSDDADQVFEDDQPYDWEVKFGHTYTSNLTPTITATVTDASGKQIGDTYTDSGKLYSGTVYTILEASNFPALTTDLYGEFTVTMEMYNGSIFMARMTKTFSRVNTNPFTATVTSRSNPDMVFTLADPIDLVLNIKKNDGVAAAYNAAVTVTKGSTELLAARGISLPASTNITLSVKDLVNLPEITKTGAYKVNLTLTDSNGKIQHQSSVDFAVVDLENNVTAAITSATNPVLVFNNVTPDLVVDLKKTDGVGETLVTEIVIKNSSGSTVFSNTFTSEVPASGTATVTPNLASIKSVGTYSMTATVKDDAGNERGSASATFQYTNTTPMTCSVTTFNFSNTGAIYTDSDNFYLNLRITHAPSAGQTMTVKATGTLNGKPFVSNTKKATLSSSGGATVKVDGAMLGSYGIFEDLAIEVYDANGVQMWKSTQTYNFSRVLTTSDPGDLSLLNINDHFTSGKGDSSLKLSLAANTGAGMWRSTIPWVTVEKSEGVYNVGIDAVVSVMSQSRNLGMQSLIILAYGNDEIYGAPNPGNSTWLTAYANYCYEVAKYMAQNYPDQVVGFEIWNEWNHATMSKVPEQYRTGAYYVKVVKAASEKIRQVNAEYGTSFKVIAGATAGDAYGTDSNSNTFVKAMFRASGFFDAVDGVSFHTYSSRETTDSSDNPRIFEYISPAEHDFAARILNYKNLLTQYNAPDDLEIWLTETGWTTNTEPEYSTGTTDGGKQHITYGATEEEAAAYMVQLYAWALADGTLDRIFWYDLMNDISNQTGIWAENQTESNYGLLHNWANSGDQPLAYSAKLGYVAMCALSSKLAGATNGKTMNLGSGIYAYQFSKDGKYITVAWTDGDAKDLTVTLNSQVVVTDMYGNSTTLSGSTGTLSLSECPIYIEYASGAIGSIG